MDEDGWMKMDRKGWIDGGGWMDEGGWMRKMDKGWMRGMKS